MISKLVHLQKFNFKSVELLSNDGINKLILMRYNLDYGIKNVGHFALRCLRIEKFIPFWGEEITGDTTPNEVNRAYKVKFDKQYFIGTFYHIRKGQL